METERNRHSVRKMETTTENQKRPKKDIYVEREMESE